MSDDGWRFDIDDVGEDAEGTDGESSRPRGEGVAGSTDARLPDPEPQPVAFENVFFVLVGAATMVGIIALLLL